MLDRKDQLKKEIKFLVRFGTDILIAEVERKEPSQDKGQENLKDSKKEQPNLKDVPLEQAYQSWYSQSLPVIKQIMPERYNEFIELYKLDKRKEIDYLTYCVSDYLIHLSVRRGLEEVDSLRAFVSKFQKQILILKSGAERIDSILSNIQGTLQADLFDNELGAASELLKKGHIRAAGAWRASLWSVTWRLSVKATISK